MASTGMRCNQNVGTSNQQQQQSSLDQNKLSELISKVQYAMLTTETEDGLIRSRPMMTKQIDDSGDIYFLTGHDTGKVREISQHPRVVNLSYASDMQNIYVSVSGRATETRGKEIIKQLWNEAYRAWFVKGVDDPNISAVRVTVELAEYWDTSSSSIVHAVGYIKAKLSGEQFNPVEAGIASHGTVKQ